MRESSSRANLAKIEIFLGKSPSRHSRALRPGKTSPENAPRQDFPDGPRQIYTIVHLKYGNQALDWPSLALYANTTWKIPETSPLDFSSSDYHTMTLLLLHPSVKVRDYFTIQFFQIYMYHGVPKPHIWHFFYKRTIYI